MNYRNEHGRVSRAAQEDGLNRVVHSDEETIGVHGGVMSRIESAFLVLEIQFQLYIAQPSFCVLQRFLMTHYSPILTCV